MRNFIWPFVLLALIQPAGSQPPARVPVLLELFTSEGCSSCPPADRLLEKLDSTQPIPGADLIVLSEHVDYWNQLGWKDPYSSAQFSERQQSYASRLHKSDIYTPQLMIDGAIEALGSDPREVESGVHNALHAQKSPLTIADAAREGDHINARVEVPSSHGAKLFVAIADNRDQSSVSRGENAGHSLSHVAVVRTLRVFSARESGEQNITIPATPANPAGQRLVAFLQDPASGRVLAVASRKL